MSWQALAVKELKEHTRPAGKWSMSLIASAAGSVLFGIGATVFVGIMMHELSAPTAGLGLQLRIAFAALAGLAASAFVPILLPMNIGLDTIVGERERHTLETLLAGPLKERDILWGKTVAILLMGALVSMIGGVAVFLTLIVLYLHFGLLWGLGVIIASALVPLIPMFVVCCWAYVFAIRAKTLKDAGQKMSFALIPFFLVPQFTLMLLPALSPVARVIVVIVAGLLGSTITVLGPLLAFIRFRRDRLLV